MLISVLTEKTLSRFEDYWIFSCKIAVTAALRGSSEAWDYLGLRLICPLIRPILPEKVLSDIHQYNYEAIENGHINSPYLRERSFFSSESKKLLKEILETDHGIGRYRAKMLLEMFK